MEANRVWGHSPAEGMANIVDDNHFSFFLTDVYAHEMVEIRALFSSDSLPDAAMQPGQRLSAVLEGGRGLYPRRSKRQCLSDSKLDCRHCRVGGLGGVAGGAVFQI